MKASYFLGFGGNSLDTQGRFIRAIQNLEQSSFILRACSQVYISPPLPLPCGQNIEQNDFYNILAEFQSELAPQQVMEYLLEIEKRLGRVRDSEAIPWGPRAIDIDIIAYGAENIAQDGLLIPHPRMHERLFVLLPMQEIAPNWKHPLNGLSLKEMIETQRGTMPCKIVGPLQHCVSE